MSRYIKNLSSDISRWQELGLLSPDVGHKILQDAELRQKRSWFRLPVVLSFLGALLVFAGVISYVAANWVFMAGSLKIGLLMGLMIIAFLSADAAEKRQVGGVSQGLALLGVLLFGANVMLVGQVYHLPPNPPAFMLLWAGAAAVVAFFWPSQMCAALSFALMVGWALAMSFGKDNFLSGHYVPSSKIAFFLLPWAGMVLLSMRRSWGYALHTSGLALGAWILLFVSTMFGNDWMYMIGFLLSMALLIFHMAGYVVHTARVGAGILSKYMWVFFAGWAYITSIPDAVKELSNGDITPLWALLCVATAAVCVSKRFMLLAGAFALSAFVISLPAMQHDVAAVLSCCLVMLASVGMVIDGYRRNETFFINMGFAFFALKLLWLYFDTVWALQSRAIVFILGGLLVIGLGVVFDRERRKLIAKMGETA